MSQTDNVFAASIPALYDQYLGSLLFQPYARDIADRLSYLTDGRLLETAAGTGIVTRALAAALSNQVQIVATDLNQPMVDHAAMQFSSSRVAWQKADALKLPFEDASFDCVVCQFGITFVPDKLKAYREALRVLKAGGSFIFNVWDKIEENEFAQSLGGLQLTDSTVGHVVKPNTPWSRCQMIDGTPSAHFVIGPIATPWVA